jgi:hypothetical protein
MNETIANAKIRNERNKERLFFIDVIIVLTMMITPMR